MDDIARKTTAAAAIAASTALLAASTPGATGVHPWLTIGRVTYLILQNYSLTGSTASDLATVFIVLLISSPLALGRRHCIYVVAPALAGLILSITDYTLGSYVLGWIALAIYAWLTTKTSSYKAVLYGFLGLLGVLGGYKIVYVLTRITTGMYPWATMPVWLDLIINYYSWPVVVGSVIAVSLLSLYLLLARPAGAGIPEWIKRLGIKSQEGSREGKSREKEKYLLLFSIALSFFLAAMPFIPSMNPSGRPIATDYIYYLNWLRQAKSQGVVSVMLARSDRPLYILILYLAMALTGAQPSSVSALQDTVLFPLYTFSTYLLARRTMGGEAAGYAALMAATSPLLLSYAYGGFQADLFTLSLTYIGLALLLGGTRREWIGGLVVLGTTMFFHEWTWTQYTIILLAYTVLEAVTRLRSRGGLDWRTKALVIYLAVIIPLDLLKTWLLGLFSSARVVEAMSRPGTIKGFIQAHHFYTTLYTGGSLSNSLFYLLAIPGVFAAHPLLLATTSLSLITALIPYNIMYYRLLLNTPLPVLAGYTVSRMNKTMQILIALEMVGLALLRILSFIPGLSLTW